MSDTDAREGDRTPGSTHEQKANTTVIFGEEVHVCPCCGSEPDPRAVGAGIEEGYCKNDDCLVASYKLWP